MSRIDLFVSFAEKDQVKSLGAKWDAANKLWYVPDGVDPAPFKQWINKGPSTTPNARCNRFYVATAIENCWKCSSPTMMLSFILPRGWEELRDSEETEGQHWERQEIDVLLNYVRYMNEAALNAVQEISSQYKFGVTPDYRRKNYLNHCDKCGVIQIEPNSGNSHVFKPETIEQAEKITLYYFNEPFEASVGFISTLRCHGGANAFDYMQHASNNFVSEK